jgi:hypothetical protein
VISFFQVALQFALGPPVLQSGAIESNAFNKTLRMARFIRGIVKRILQRRRTDVHDQNFLGPLALERESVWIIILAKCSLRFRGIGQEHFCPISDRPRNVPHCAGLGDDD